MKEATGHRHTTEIVGTSRRMAAIELLKANAPAMLDWLAEPAPGVLPVVVVTKDGFRLAALQAGADGGA